MIIDILQLFDEIYIYESIKLKWTLLFLIFIKQCLFLYCHHKDRYSEIISGD